MSTFQIRSAHPTDTANIFKLIQALAAYEKLEHAVTGSPDQLHEHLFGSNPVAAALLADVPESPTPVGLALYFRSFSTFLTQPGLYLEDLYVEPPYRGRGIGKAFLIHLAQMAVAGGYGRLEWVVLDWNEPAIQFYQRMGSTLMKEWIINRVTGQALIQLAQAAEAPSTSTQPRQTSG